MPYNHFIDSGSPDISDSGQTVITETRENLEALRDGIMSGVMPNWDVTISPNGGTQAEPRRIEWRKDGNGVLALRASITWGTSGGADGNPTSISWQFTGNRTSGTPTWDALGTCTLSYNAGGDLVSVTW